MGDVSSKLMAQFADNLNEMIDEQGVGASSDAEPPAPAPANASPTTDTDTDTDTGTGTGTGTGTETDDVPQVRKIEGPASEPIDLMEVGGSSLVKRVVPALVAIVLVLLIIRRRRG